MIIPYLCEKVNPVHFGFGNFLRLIHSLYHVIDFLSVRFIFCYACIARQSEADPLSKFDSPI